MSALTEMHGFLHDNPDLAPVTATITTPAGVTVETTAFRIKEADLAQSDIGDQASETNYLKFKTSAVVAGIARHPNDTDTVTISGTVYKVHIVRVVGESCRVDCSISDARTGMAAGTLRRNPIIRSRGARG